MKNPLGAIKNADSHARQTLVFRLKMRIGKTLGSFPEGGTTAGALSRGGNADGVRFWVSK